MTDAPASRVQVLLLAAFATLILIPVTLPVPVLRGFVQERFAVSDLATSVFMSINMAGAVLAAPVAGALADRFGRHKPWIVAALAADALCFFALTQDVPFAAFLAIRFVEGCAHIVALSLVLSLAGALAETFGRGRVMGLVGAGLTLGVAIGAPIGGILGKRYGDLVPVQAGGCVLVVTALLFALLVRDADARHHRPALREILRLVRGNRAVLVPLAYAFADRFTVGFFTTTFTLYLHNVHDLPSDHIGTLLGLFLGPFCLLSYTFGRLSERVSKALMVAGGSLCYGLLLATLGLWSVASMPYGMFALGVLAAVMFVPSLILTTQLVPPAIRSTALGAFNAAGSLGFIAGPLVGGAVSQWAGYASAFAVAGASEVLCAVVTLPLLLRFVRARRTT